MTRGLKGGHLEGHGLSEDHDVIDVTEHRHQVELDLFRVELSLSRTLNEKHDVVFRVPYFIKDQAADVLFVPDTPGADQAAAVRNGNIHHRQETYEGLGDGELTVGWRTRGLLWDTSTTRLSAGVTLPFGETESDPWLAGDAGQEHLHIQFGNGTVDPVIDAYFGVPINEQWGWSVYGKARLPLLENSKGYRGAPEYMLLPRVMYMPQKKASVYAGISANYFGYSRWEKTGRDENSGLFSVYASLGGGYKVADFTTASISVQVPLYTDVFSNEDGLDSEPAFSISVSQQF
ncbi:MAG: hypothetical protein ACI9TH_003149 [Kiritimatiellia bacterium]|jgi:hypothetical protein